MGEQRTGWAIDRPIGKYGSHPCDSRGWLRREGSDGAIFAIIQIGYQASDEQAAQWFREFAAAPKMLAELRALSEHYGWRTTADVIAEATGEAP
jgi:hypothetical protein